MKPFTIFLICVGLAALFFVLSILLTPGKRAGGESIGRGTRFFLVVLRLAIGWHFLTEGLDKLNNPAWSSENYLRAASGPLANYFRGVADEDVLAKLTLTPENYAELLQAGASIVGAMAPAGEPAPLTAVTSLSPGRTWTLPPALDKEWQRYFEKVHKEFELDERQTAPARIALNNAKAATLFWMASRQTIKKLSPYVDRSVDMTVAERIAYYHALVDEIDSTVASSVISYGAAAEEKLKRARDEADYIIKDLKVDLAKQTAAMQDALRTALPASKSKLNLPAMSSPPVSEWTQLDWSDHVVPWALTVVGTLLIVGLLTRPACLVGALWMLLLYVSMMPLPGWPEPARSEGHYLFINKNFIEMVALLALMTTRSGRWLGLDALFGLMFAKRRRTPEAAATKRGSESARRIPAGLPGR